MYTLVFNWSSDHRFIIIIISLFLSEQLLALEKYIQD